MKQIFLCAGAASALTFAGPALAHEALADDHAPIGVMADHAHKEGEVMFSFRYMHMDMGGNQVGTDSISNDAIVTSIPNRFAGAPMQPPTLRIVPTEMRTDMYMLGAMYAPSDAVTLMVMGNYLEKEMDHVSYQGGMGTTVLGEFQTNPKAFGDTKVAALFPLLGLAEKGQVDFDQLTLKAGVSLPTGSTDETAEILTPMGTRPTVRVPYMMQTGTGTFDLEPSLTYLARRGAIGFGAQVAAAIRMDQNKWDYAFGDSFEATGWVSYRPASWVSFSARVKARTMGRIDGADPTIFGPVQTANPDFQGGERVDVLGGVNFVSTHGALAGHRLLIEVGAPIYQDLNGPQMAGDWTFTVGWQKGL